MTEIKALNDTYILKHTFSEKKQQKKHTCNRDFDFCFNQCCHPSPEGLHFIFNLWRFSFEVDNQQAVCQQSNSLQWFMSYKCLSPKNILSFKNEIRMCGGVKRQREITH